AASSTWVPADLVELQAPKARASTSARHTTCTRSSQLVRFIASSSLLTCVRSSSVASDPRVQVALKQNLCHSPPGPGYNGESSDDGGVYNLPCGSSRGGNPSLS